MSQNGSSTQSSQLPRPSRLPLSRGSLGIGRSQLPRPSAVSSSRGNTDDLKSSVSNGLRSSRPGGSPSKSGRGSASFDQPSNTGSNLQTPTKKYVSESQAVSRRLESGNLTSALEEIPDLNRGSRRDLHPSINADNSKPLEVAKVRKSRPSLSERTVETLSQIPPSPSPRRRSSAYGSPVRSSSAIGGRSRPGSALGFSGQHDRPSSRNASLTGPPQQRQSSRAGLSSSATPNRRSFTTGNARRTSSSFARPDARPASALSDTRERNESPTRPSYSGSTYGARQRSSSPVKPRPSLSRLVENDQSPSNHAAPGPKKPLRAGKTAPVERNAAPTSARVTSTPTQKMHRAQKLDKAVPASPKSPNAGLKSSQALRESIAKAKAQQKAAVQPPAKQINHGVNGGFDSNDIEDSESQSATLEGNSGLLRKRLDAARSDGRLNLAALGIREIPKEVLFMYDTEAQGNEHVVWFQTVDLAHMDLAGNNIEDLSPDLFPKQEEQEDDVCVFGGIQSLDVHGNRLAQIPTGLSQLRFLTKLHLSHNRLTNESLDIICGCSGLTELRLARNRLSGDLDIALPSEIEQLDLQGNSLTQIPESVLALQSLRVLNVSGNSIQNLKMESLQSTSLVEIHASKNSLDCIRADQSAGGFPRLRVLQLACNSISSMGDSLPFPELQQLDLSSNRLSYIPGVAPLKQLLTIKLEDNTLSDLPAGFITLSNLKTASLAGNNLKTIPNEMGLMSGLTLVDVNRNPLRERHFLGLNTADLKNRLKQRLESDADAIEASQGEPWETSEGPARSSALHSVPSDGVLDLSSRNVAELNAHKLEAGASSVRSVILTSNILTAIPENLSLFSDSLRSLNLSKNKISGDDYVPEALKFSSLQTLNLSLNSITSLSVLIDNLSAPNLAELDVQVNAITEIPQLQTAYPKLRIFKANSNAITRVSVQALEGVEHVDLRDNEISHLPPELSLLPCLRMLDVRGNTFRVPRFTVLEKGNAALMAWLRDRLPEGQRATELNDDETF